MEPLEEQIERKVIQLVDFLQFSEVDKITPEGILSVNNVIR